MRALCVLGGIASLAAVWMLFGGRSTWVEPPDGAGPAHATKVGSGTPSPAPEVGAAAVRTQIPAVVDRSGPREALGDSERVTELRVRVVTESGVGIEGVDVVAEAVDPDEPRRLRSRDRKGTTDAEGWARLRLFDAEFLIGANRRRSLVDYTTESVQVEIGLEDVSVELPLRDCSASLLVTLVRPTGDPVGGANVRLSANELPVPGSPVDVARRTRSERSGDDGVVWFRHLVQGEYALYFPADQEAQRGLAYPKANVFTLLAGEAKELRLVMSGTARIRYRLSETLSPGVEGSVFFSRRNDYSRRDPEPVIVEGDGQGIVEVVPGDWDAICYFGSGSEYVGETSEVVDVQVGDLVDLTIPILRFSGVVSGVTVYPDGRPAPRASLQAYSDESCRNHLRRTRSDDEGRFVMKGIPSGPVFLFACHELAVEHDYDNPSLILSGPSKDLTVELRPSWTIQGVVHYSDSDLPIEAGAPIHLYQWGSDVGAGAAGVHVARSTEEGGAFRFDGVMPMNYMVVVGDPWDNSGEESTWKEVSVSNFSEGARVLDFRLSAPTSWLPPGE